MGHRDAPNTLFPALFAQVERHISEYGVREFLVGHYGAFDHLAAKAVIKAKQRHPEATLTLLLPYHPAERHIELPMGFDGSVYPPDMEKTPRRYAIVKANQYAVEECGHLIAYAWQAGSNTVKIVEYARKKGKDVTLVER